MNQSTTPRRLLPPAVEEFIRRTNPWWEGKPGPSIASYRRWPFDAILRKLKGGMTPAVAIRGPRQVGKTTLELQILDHLIHSEGVNPRHILWVQFDDVPSLKGVSDPILCIAWWFEDNIVQTTLNQLARDGTVAYLFFDEVQNLQAWAPQLKALVDHNSVEVLITGSSAMQIAAGQDSLAGRITQVDLGTLLVREVAAMRFGENIRPHLPNNGLEALLQIDFWRSLQTEGKRLARARDRGFVEFARRGGYPIAHAHPDLPWEELAEQLNETVVRRVLQHDLQRGPSGQRRNPRMLEEVFLLACHYAGQAPGSPIFLPEIRRSLGAEVSWTSILSYLQHLDNSLLLRLVRPLELRLRRRKGNSKLCLCDHSLRASWLREVVPLDVEALRAAPQTSDLAGHLAESVVGYFLGAIPHLGLAHYPEREGVPEVDFVLTVGTQRIPIEVKYRQRIDPHRDTHGLRAFLEKTVHNAPFGILVTMHDDVEVLDPRIVPVSLPSLLLMR